MTVVLPEIGDKAFIPEVWALFGVAVTVNLLRFAIRTKTVGFKGFQGDDYFSIVTLTTYTMGTVLVHKIFYTGTNVEASVVRQTQKLTPADIKQFELGSKQLLAAWYSYTALLWSMKAVVLFFFNRLTVGLWQHKFIKWLAGVCIVTYLTVMLTVTFSCFPTQKNWQVVPDPGPQCTFKLQNFLVTAVLNVITDALILAIPVPLLWTLRVPLHRKIIISLLLCSGLFVISAAIIRVALTLIANPSATNINRWGVREAFVGMVIINAPILRPLFRKRFWSSQNWEDTSLWYESSRNVDGDRRRNGFGSVGGKNFELSETGSGSARSRVGEMVGGEMLWQSPVGGSRQADLESGMGRGDRGRKRRGSQSSTGSMANIVRTNSTECIVQRNDGETMGIEVNVQTEFWVESESLHEDGHGVQEQREESWVREEREEKEQRGHMRMGSTRSARRGRI